MNKRELALLERVYETEVRSAIYGGPRLCQATSRLADAMVDDGLLTKSVEIWRGVRIKGYELTHAGRFAYCATCADLPP